MGKDLVNTEKFDYMFKDKVCTSVTIQTCNGKQTVSIKNYTDDLVDRLFGINENPTIEDLNKALEERCFPRTRYNCKEVLKHLDLPFYDPMMIIRKTHGVFFDDFMWIRFEDEPNLKWKDVRCKERYWDD